MVTLGDVAAAAGTSTTTVSRVLNGCGDSHRISARTQQAVTTAAEELGYRPSYHARALKAGRSNTIGLMCNADILSGHGQGYFGGMIDGLNSLVRKQGYNLLLTSDDDRHMTLEQGVIFWKEQRVDALITFGYIIERYMATNTPLAPDTVGLPLVLIESQWPLEYPIVSMNCASAINDAVGHLADLGHQCITYLLPTSSQADDRRSFFEIACKARKVEARIVTVDFPNDRQHDRWETIANRAKAIDQIWSQLADCPAVMAYNDHMALGFQLAAHNRGCHVPHDFSLIGFDDLYAQTALPPMSTISHGLQEMGQRAGTIALEMATSPDAVKTWNNRRETVEAVFIPRGSTGPCPH
ncbi:MAG: LacI family DNA-binding transcriptional regulator [Planctomycetota bacterium]|jgi:DNA-binding LacI/PurR family transcriptional regulator|nr:LacI family DNA-binding transcriptional regulator [Planctomycetota bacterium]